MRVGDIAPAQPFCLWARSHQDRPSWTREAESQFKCAEGDASQVAPAEYIDRASERSHSRPTAASQWFASEFLRTRQGRMRRLSCMQRTLSPPVSWPEGVEGMKNYGLDIQELSGRADTRPETKDTPGARAAQMGE